MRGWGRKIALPASFELALHWLIDESLIQKHQSTPWLLFVGLVDRAYSQAGSLVSVVDLARESVLQLPALGERALPEEPEPWSVPHDWGLIWELNMGWEPPYQARPGFDRP